MQNSTNILARKYQGNGLILYYRHVRSGNDFSVLRISYRQCGIINISQPYRPPRPVIGIALLFRDGVCFL
jgi:hypothetical protein